MKIKTKFVPRDLRKLFTEGKEYAVLDPNVRVPDRRVINDKGNSCYTQAENPPIKELVWEVVNPNFDITKHEWNHPDIELTEVCGVLGNIVLCCQDNMVDLVKEDAIALAKHFKLTEADL